MRDKIRLGVPHDLGVGLFAHAWVDHFPHLPAEDDMGLRDPLIFKRFREQIQDMEFSRRQAR